LQQTITLDASNSQCEGLYTPTRAKELKKAKQKQIKKIKPR
jgi:hypothetical protein